MKCLMTIVSIQCIFIIGLVAITQINKKNNDTLRLVHILFRHGERSPDRAYKNDPHKAYPWQGGWNQLTKQGKLEEYELGLFVRERYKDFLSVSYEPDDILIESSYADRCITSAQLLLAGLYPPKGDQIWNEHLLWQPIPIHSLPRHLDNKIAVGKQCNKYANSFEEMLKSERIQHIQDKNRELYNYTSLHTGEDVHTILTLENIYNILEIQEINNLTLPNWTASVFPNKMKFTAATALQMFTETDYMKKIKGGMLTKEIITNMEAKVKGSLPKRKMQLYAGHDLTLVSLLRVLGFEELIKPGFGAALIIELHDVDEKPIIKFFYKDNPFLETVELFSSHCSTNCDLQEYMSYIQNYLPDDWDKECEL